MNSFEQENNPDSRPSAQHIRSIPVQQAIEIDHEEVATVVAELEGEERLAAANILLNNNHNNDPTTIDQENAAANFNESENDDENQQKPAAASISVPSQHEEEEEIPQPSPEFFMLPEEEEIAESFVSPTAAAVQAEPQLDISQVDFIRGNDISISALTTHINNNPNTDSFVNDDVHDDELHSKHYIHSTPANAATAAVAPPAIPPPRAFYSDSGALVTSSTPMDRDAVAMLPDYKDQVRSHRMQQHLQADAQSRPSKRVATVGSSSRNVSNQSGESSSGSSGQRHTIHSNYYTVHHQHEQEHHDEDACHGHIPVVPAVLVPMEDLSEQERQEISSNSNGGRQSSQGSNSNNQASSSAVSTLSTLDESSHPDNQQDPSSSRQPSSQNSNRRRPKVPPPSSSSTDPQAEKRFWITVIAVALFLNSLLVAGIVVGGFCAAGKCSMSSKEPMSSAEPLAPSPAPSLSRYLSAIPSQTPIYTPSPTIGMAIFDPTDATAAPTVVDPFQNSTAFPTATTLGPENGDTLVGKETPDNGSNNKEVATLAPTTTTITITGGGGGGSITAITTAPTFSPVAPVDILKNNDTDTNAQSPQKDKSTFKSKSMLTMAMIAVTAEVIIVGGLYMYYRRWKKRRQLEQPNETNCNDSDTTVPNNLEDLEAAVNTATADVTTSSCRTRERVEI